MQAPNRIAELRAAAGLTQEQIAARVGRSPSAVARWESHINGIPDGLKPKVAAVLGVSVGHLMCWEDS